MNKTVNFFVASLMGVAFLTAAPIAAFAVTCSGRVAIFDADTGPAIAGARITAKNLRTNQIVEVISDQNGRFTMSNLTSERWSFSCYKEGFTFWSLTFPAQGNILTFQGDYDGCHFLASNVVVISGRVISPSGSGMGGVRVTISGGPASVPPPLNNQPVSTDAAGAYSFMVYRATDITYTVTPVGGTFNPPDRVFQGYINNSPGQDFTVTYNISGKVTDAATGLPLADATVSAGSLRARTDTSGNYTLGGLDPGVWTVTAFKDGYLLSKPAAMADLSGSSGNVRGIDFALERPGVIRVQVKKGDTAAGLGGMEVWSNGVKAGDTNENGIYEIKDLYSGSYAVSIKKKGYGTAPSSENVVLAPADKEETVTFHARKNILIIFVHGQGGSAKDYVAYRTYFDRYAGSHGSELDTEYFMFAYDTSFTNPGNLAAADNLNQQLASRISGKDYAEACLIAMSNGTLVSRFAIRRAAGMLKDFYARTTFIELSPLLGGSSDCAQPRFNWNPLTWAGPLLPGNLFEKSPVNEDVRDLFQTEKLPRNGQDIRDHYEFLVFGDANNRYVWHGLSGVSAPLTEQLGRSSLDAFVSFLRFRRIYHSNVAQTQTASLINASGDQDGFTIFYDVSDSRYTQAALNVAAGSGLVAGRWNGAARLPLDIDGNLAYQPEGSLTKHTVVLYYKPLILKAGKIVFGQDFTLIETGEKAAVQKSASKAAAMSLDVNRDGATDFRDIVGFMNSFGSMAGQDTFEQKADLDNDGIVSFPDFDILEAGYVPATAEAKGATEKIVEKLAILADFGSPSLLGDINYDGVIDRQDLDKVRNNMGKTFAKYGDGDVTGDGAVDSADEKLVLGRLNQSLGGLFGAHSFPFHGSIFQEGGAIALAGYFYNAAGNEATSFSSFVWSAIDEQGVAHFLGNGKILAVNAHEPKELARGRYKVRCAASGGGLAFDYSADIEIGGLTRPDAMILGVDILPTKNQGELVAQVKVWNARSDARGTLKMSIAGAGIEQLSQNKVVSLPANQRTVIPFVFFAPNVKTFRLSFVLAGIEDELLAGNNAYTLQVPALPAAAPVLNSGNILFAPSANPLPAEQRLYIASNASDTGGKEIKSYQWSIDGVVMRNNNKPGFALELSSVSEGVHTLALTVTAGSGTMLTQSVKFTRPEKTLPPPANLTATAMDHAWVRLGWKDMSVSETGFMIQRSSVRSNWATIATVGADAQMYDDFSGLVEGATYNYRVQAIRADGNSGYTAVVSVDTKPAIPVDLKLSQILPPPHITVTFSWVNNSMSARNINIYRAMASNGPYAFVRSVTRGVNSFEDRGPFTRGGTYYYKVRAAANGRINESNDSGILAVKIP